MAYEQPDLLGNGLEGKDELSEGDGRGCLTNSPETTEGSKDLRPEVLE
jgi:hypothetical protein